MAYTAAWLTVMVAVLAAGGGVGPGAGAGVGDGGRPGGGAAGGGAPAPVRSGYGAGARVRAGCTGPPGPAARCWPVAGPGARGRPLVLRGFEPPATAWAAGHRGVDLSAAPRVEVRAAAAGEVAFAGPVAGVPVVVVALPGGLRTTYEPVRAAVAVGARVAAGDRLGEAAAEMPAHCAAACVHWGLLRGDVYLDPLTLLPPALRRAGPSRLLPVDGAARA
ncbi:peptidoglycan DD-metalloendopeptidase family protein [Streptomyces sp. NPDC088194]|uniref:peptidoglycan DD-metalloendopeptidase family protein n=1 Tax=Streptomyces sp. NPDC088194 TaxID=3154931 RepID=UPI00344F4BDD